MEGAETNGWSMCVVLLGAHWMAGSEPEGEEDTREHMSDINVLLNPNTVLYGSR